MPSRLELAEVRTCKGSGGADMQGLCFRALVLCESVLLSCSESVLLSCSNSRSWPSRSRCLVSVVTHARPATEDALDTVVWWFPLMRQRLCGSTAEALVAALASSCHRITHVRAAALLGIARASDAAAAPALQRAADSVAASLQQEVARAAAEPAGVVAASRGGSVVSEAAEQQKRNRASAARSLAAACLLMQSESLQATARAAERGRAGGLTAGEVEAPPRRALGAERAVTADGQQPPNDTVGDQPPVPANQQALNGALDTERVVPAYEQALNGALSGQPSVPEYRQAAAVLLHGAAATAAGTQFVQSTAFLGVSAGREQALLEDVRAAFQARPDPAQVPFQFDVEAGEQTLPVVHVKRGIAGAPLATLLVLPPSRTLPVPQQGYGVRREGLGVQARLLATYLEAQGLRCVVVGGTALEALARQPQQDRDIALHYLLCTAGLGDVA